MPSALTYPGVYVEEIPSGVRTITGVSTANTAFVDYFRRGPMNVATRLTSLAEFDRIFGGIDPNSEASYGIAQYFLNGGSVAWVVRVAGGDDAATDDAGKPPAKATLRITGPSPGDNPSLLITALSEGTWANTAVEVAIVREPPPTPPSTGGAGGTGGTDGNGDEEDEGTQEGPFNLFVRQLALDSTGTPVREGGRPKELRVEVYRNVSIEPTAPNFVEKAVAGSELIEVARDVDPGEGDEAPKPTVAPASSKGTATGEPRSAAAWRPPGGGAFAGGRNGTVPAKVDELLGKSDASLRALDLIAPEIFNMLCLPAIAAKGFDTAQSKSAYDRALAYCIEKRAFLLVDVPETIKRPTDMRAALGDLPSDNHAAVYFPRLLMPDPADGGRPRNVASSGTLAGIYARTDATRGVWKAPAGTDATIRGADLATIITDGDNGGLNPFGINARRNFPVFNTVVWGARTLDGADAEASEWKYVPVRRTALFIEESLFQALKWVVFEPNDEPLWAQIRLNVGAFMNDLFRQGAFQGRTPREAYLVKCDRETTTQNDINRGVVNVVVGFAPLKPAEFVVIKIQQIAGQVQV